MAAEAMLRSLQFLLTLFVLLKGLVLAQEGNQFIYHGFSEANLSLGGIAKLHANGLLELTSTAKQAIGRAFFPVPLRFNSRSLSFSTNFVFAMIPETPDAGGHGIAFTISPSLEFKGAFPTQYLGLFNDTSNGLLSNHVLAVELDSTPTFEFRDINQSHVGIDINSMTSIDSAPATYFSDHEEINRSLQLLSGDPTQVWIDYDEEEELLNVTIAPMRSKKPTRPLLSTPINISQVFLDSMYVGFSASTGQVASYQYILGWSFNQSGQAQNFDISKLPSFPQQRKSSKGYVKIMAPLITVTGLLITVCGIAYLRRKRHGEIREDWEQEYGPQRFSYKDLYKATKGFTDKELVGSGGFGSVYRGVLPASKLQVAVKKVSHDSQQSVKQFVAEIASMRRLRHRNLVPLLGYCRRKAELLLVSEFMPNGSLDKFLFSKEKPCLSWVHRYQILKGVASGLLYLHEEWEQVVLHRDIKASNVMLDAEFNGRLGDFGLAKFHDHGTNPQTTIVVGTVGYLAPEITRTGKPTTSSDVFSFGIFMLEMACGRKPVEPQRAPGEIILVDWILECWRRGAILGTTDPRMEGNYVVEEMELVLKLGMLCANSIPAARPSMRQVLQYLEGNAVLPDIPLEGASVNTVPILTSRENISAHSFFISTTESILSYGR